MASPRESASEREARDALIEDYLPLAEKLARRFSTTVGLDEDLRQTAIIGLILAAERFDHEQGNFAAFAIPTITGTLKKHLRATGWAVHVPRRIQENVLHIERSIDALTGRLGRAPTMSEVSTETGLTAEEIYTARKARQARHTAPIEEARNSGVGDDTEQSELRTAIESLDADARELLAMRYNEHLTQTQIADRLGISQPQVHRRLQGITDSLRIDLQDHSSNPDVRNRLVCK